MNEFILFAEWIAVNHYRLVNVDTVSGEHQWRNENGIKTTYELMDDFNKHNTYPPLS